MNTTGQYDTYRITHGGVTALVEAVSYEEATLVAATALEAYSEDWMIHNENPDGVVRVTSHNDYHLIIWMPTGLLKQRRQQATQARFNQQFAWLARAVPVNGIQSTMDYTVDPDRTPTEGLICDLSDGGYETEVEPVEAKNA